MDPIEQLKAWARRIRQQKRLPWLDLSHGQCLEVSVTLTTKAHSWNEYAAAPAAPQLPETIQGYFGAVARAQRRIGELGVAPTSARSGRSYAAMYFLGILGGDPDEPYRMPWQLLGAAGTPVPNIFDSGDVAPADDPRYLNIRLSDWFFRQHVGLDRKYGDYPWDRTQQLALTMGFSSDDAALIRAIQREAPNHSWDLLSWLEVGVLDPDQEAFLRELQNETDWRDNFAKWLRTDDGRVEDSE